MPDADLFSVMLKCHDPDGEFYYLSLARTGLLFHLIRMTGSGNAWRHGLISTGTGVNVNGFLPINPKRGLPASGPLTGHGGADYLIGDWGKNGN